MSNNNRTPDDINGTMREFDIPRIRRIITFSAMRGTIITRCCRSNDISAKFYFLANRFAWFHVQDARHIPQLQIQFFLPLAGADWSRAMDISFFVFMYTRVDTLTRGFFSLFFSKVDNFRRNVEVVARSYPLPYTFARRVPSDLPSTSILNEDSL